jgi:methyl-accepting chemotaxis protein
MIRDAVIKHASEPILDAYLQTSTVASNISDVERGSSETGTASAEVLSAAQSLSAQSQRLKSEVSTFLMTVRAA